MSKPSLSLDDAQLRGMTKGNLERASRANPKPSLRAGRPKFPADDLPEDARPVWKTLTKNLAQRRTLTPGDGHQMTLYCRTFLQWKLACKDVETNGVMVAEERYSREGNPYTVRVQNPCVKIAQSLYAELKDALKEMGLTGLARDKVSQVKKEDQKPADVPGTVGFYARQAADFGEPEVEVDDAEIEEEANGNTDEPIVEPRS